MESLASEEMFNGRASSDIEEASSSSSSSEFVDIKDWYRSADGKRVGDVVNLFTECNTEILDCGDGRKVPISYLEGKVVGLYFYSCLSSDFVFRELGYMYEKLRNDHGESFEIVFLCRHRRYFPISPELSGDLLAQWEGMFEKRFHKYFQGKSWLASPFSNRECNERLYSWSFLLRDSHMNGPAEFLISEPPELVIIQPSENIAHAYAMDIYREFGIDAYPFSKSKLTEFEVARLKTFTLENVLCFDEQLIDQNRLKGKKILLFLDPHCPEKLKLFYKKLGKWYKDLKGKDEEFEMIRAFYMARKEEEEEEAAYGYEKNSWVELPYMEDMIHKLEDIFKYTGMKVKMAEKIPIMVAFGQDGKFITINSLEDLIPVGNYSQFPDFFNGARLYMTVSDSIAIEKKWYSIRERNEDVSFYDF